MEKTDSPPVVRTIELKNLRKGARHITAPFRLILNDHNDPIQCDEVVRIMPGKRLVAFGTWGDQPIVAKLFYSFQKAQKHLKEEVAGLEKLIQANVPTPKLLWQGTAYKQKIYVLLFERILNGVDLETIWQNKESIPDIFPLMQGVTIELATQHVLGIKQNDLHLKNFLITNKQIYTVDCASITQHDGILPRNESLDHLALFFAQLGVGTETLQQELFQIYARARGWIIKKTDFITMRKNIRERMEKRWLQFKDKILRDCSAFSRTEKITSIIMSDRSYDADEFNALLKNPEHIFYHPDTVILKTGRSSTVVKVTLDNKLFVVKRYNIKNFLHGLRRSLRNTRAFSSWCTAQRLRLFGIPTAKPVAYIDKRFLFFRGKSYYVMEFVEGPHIGEFLTNPTNKNEDLLTVAERTFLLFYNLAKLNLTHGDLKMTNIIIKNYQPIFIDLDGIKEHKSKLGLKSAFKKEIKRFMKNWDNWPSIKELLTECLAGKKYL